MLRFWSSLVDSFHLIDAVLSVCSGPNMPSFLKVVKIILTYKSCPCSIPVPFISRCGVKMKSVMFEH